MDPKKPMNWGHIKTSKSIGLSDVVDRGSEREGKVQDHTDYCVVQLYMYPTQKILEEHKV